MMITFKTVEDYIEVIAGERDVATLKPTFNWASEPIVSLARYDMDVVPKMAQQTLGNIGFTEKQAKLAQKIILTYKRQLAQKNIDVTPVENPEYRLPIRQMDYSMSVFLDDGFIYLKFPYNQKLIESVRSFGKESQGASRWNPEKKLWQIELSEYNVNWVAAFAEVNNFTIDPAITTLVTKISEVENSGYEICLTINDGQLTIKNAPNSLLEYVEQHIGSITPDNLLKLVDNSGILGYTVDDDITNALASEYGHRMVHLLTNRELKLDPTSMFTNDNFKSIMDYAISLDRLPVYVYEPDLSGKLLSKIRDMFNEDEVLEVKHSLTQIDISDKTKVVHITKPMKGHKIPLLVSSAGMIYGGEKEIMVQSSQKIIYCAAEVYNKRNNTGVKAFAS